ncbi:Ribosomal RNA processing protein 1-like [Babesia duncani]|uniref:Ribosomal RNA processing protein 1-like n=1 Tax=Babesia duncani TaxID=323732 RepID=A0AAD9UP41_9APIC|nr:Ribosomal RNA processing protein 1-like [Babesia duncani]
MEHKAISEICRQLADTEKSIRQKGLDAVAKYFQNNHRDLNISEVDKLTVGLYYTLWMTDGPLEFRKIAVSISKLHEQITNADYKFLFFKSLLQSIAKGWNKLDSYRLPKFELFIRIVTAEILSIIHQQQWSMDSMVLFDDLVLDKKGACNLSCRDMVLCFVFIVMEEFINNHKTFIATLKNKYTPPNAENIFWLLKPFIKLALVTDDQHVLDRIGVYIFKKLFDSKEIDGSIVHSALLQILKSSGIPSRNRKMLMKYTSQNHNMALVPERVIQELELLKEQLHLLDLNDESADTQEMDQALLVDASLEDPVNLQNVHFQDDNNVLKADEEFLTLGQTFRQNRITEGLKRKLKVSRALNRIRISIIIGKNGSKQFLEAFNHGKLHWQILFYSMHMMRRLKLINKFKCSRKLYKIYDFTLGDLRQLPSPKRTVNVQGALNALKRTRPRASALNSKQASNIEKRHVSFFLQANQVATVPRKKFSCITPLGLPSWV